MVYTIHWWWFWGWFMALIQSLSAKQGRPSWVTSWSCRDQTAITEASPKSAPAATHEPGIGFLMLKAVERMPWSGQIAKRYCQTMPSNEMLACILYISVYIYIVPWVIKSQFCCWLRLASFHICNFVGEGYHRLVAFPYSMTSWQSYLAGPKGKQLLPRERWEGRLGRVGERFFMPGLCFRCWDASIRPGG